MTARPPHRPILAAALRAVAVALLVLAIPASAWASGAAPCRHAAAQGMAMHAPGDTTLMDHAMAGDHGHAAPANAMSRDAVHGGCAAPCAAMVLGAAGSLDVRAPPAARAPLPDFRAAAVHRADPRRLLKPPRDA
jgi:hypothetical protein